MKSAAAVLVLLSMLTISTALGAEEPDWGDYGQLLKRHVSQGELMGVGLMLVDYAGLRRDPLWPKVMARLADFDPAQLESREERLAFYINAYNILAIKMVADHWPVTSIKDVGSIFAPVWKKEAGKIGGKPVSLDDIEHVILRKMGEPRMHFAIVCASISCPDLHTEPYSAASLSRQLDVQVKAFLHNPAKGLKLDKAGILISRIFSWFSADFEAAGGVRVFIRRYRQDIPKQTRITGYLPYRWELNSKSGP